MCCAAVGKAHTQRPKKSVRRQTKKGATTHLTDCLIKNIVTFRCECAHRRPSGRGAMLLNPSSDTSRNFFSSLSLAVVWSSFTFRVVGLSSFNIEGQKLQINCFLGAGASPHFKGIRPSIHTNKLATIYAICVTQRLRTSYNL